MLSYIIRRLLLMIPTLIGITMLVFFVMALSPGNVSTMLRSAEGDMRPEERRRIEEYIRKRYGLGDPLIVQYGRWLNHISPVGVKDGGRGLSRLAGASGFKKPDLGESFIRRRPVWDVIMDALPITLLLNLITIPIIYIIADHQRHLRRQASRQAAGCRHGRHVHRALLAADDVGRRHAAGLLRQPRLLPVVPHRRAARHHLRARCRSCRRCGDGEFQRGWLLDTLWHLVLPVVCLTYGGFAFLSKLMRAAVLENLTADFARTARAKGLAENVVLFRHVLANSILPLITVAASILPALLGGSLIIESIFSINGMGRLMIEAIKMKDQELVLSEMCVVTLISLVSLIVADVCYAVADPRVSYE